MSRADKEDRTTETKKAVFTQASGDTTPRLDRVRVLVVDDNPTNRKLLKLVLEAEGHSVVEADNGISALERLDQEQLDAVISDILMPEMDGYRLCYEIRKSPKFSHVPFIVYTASYTLPSDEKLAVQFGVDKFIRKPAAGNEIVNSLYEVLALADTQKPKGVEQPEEAEVMREYSQALVRKLEQTIVDLSDANRNLAERTTLAEFVATVSTAISEARGLHEMLQRCCDAMVIHLEAAFARIWTLNESENVLELQASAGIYRHIDGGHARIPVGQFEIGLIASERAPHLTNSVIGDPRVNDQTWARREGMVAFAGYPLMIGDQLVGVMALFARRTLSQNILDVMGTVAQNIAVGIQRQRAEERVNQNLNRIRALHEIDLAITSSLDLPTVLDVLLRKMELFFPYSTVSTVRLLNRTTGELEALACHNIDLDDWKNSFVDGRGGRAYNVLAGKVPLRVRNVVTHSDTASPTLFQKYGLVSYIGLPLIAKDQPLGVLNFYTKEEHEFSPEEIEFLMTLSGQAAIAIDNARLYAETERRRCEAEELARVARSLTETLDMQPIGDRIVSSIRALFGVKGATLRLLQPDGSFLWLASCGEVFSQGIAGNAVPAGKGMTDRAVNEGRPIWSANILNDPDVRLTESMRDYQVRSGHHSVIAVPLRAHDKTIGVLTLLDQTGRSYSDNEVALLQTFADQAALALENARLYDHTQRHLKRIQGVTEINDAITSTLSLSNVLDVLLEKTELFCPVPVACGVRLFDEATSHMVPLAARHLPFEEWRQEVATAKGRLTQLLMDTKKPVAIMNMLTDSRTSMNNFARRHGLVSYLGVPLIVRDKFIGNLVIYTKEEHAFSAEEIDFFTNLGSQAAIAIHNAQLHEQTERQLKRIEALREIDKAITSTLDLSTVLNVLLQKLDLFFTYPSAATVRLFDKHSGLLEPAAARNIELAEWVTAMRGVQRDEKSYGKVVIEEKAPLTIPNLQDDARTQHPEFYRKHGLISYAGIPLIAKDEVLGVLGIYTKQEHHYSDEEIELLKTLAGQAAIAIHNAKLFEEIVHSKNELETTNRFLDRSLNQLGSLHTALTPLALSESLTEMIDGIITRLMEATGADAVLIRIWDQSARNRPVVAERGYTWEFSDEPRRERSEGAIHWVIQNNQPIIAPDIASEVRLRWKRQLRMGFRSCAILPLRVHGEICGVIQLSSRTLGYFDEEQKDHLLAIARQMSIALENRELFYNLQTSRNELERASKVKDEFLSVMSHELRTPLSVVTGYSMMLRQEQLGPLTNEQERALDVIQRNARELYTMIDSIMDATKIESGSMVAEMDTVSPSQLLAELKLSYDFPNRKNISVEWNCPEALPPLWTDLRKLRQILTNLINNAIKFTDEGSITISAEDRNDAKTDKSEHSIEFRVADSGIGIPPGECEKIFERFHQVDGSGTRSFEGVGLGLYIVKSFTEMLGGRVSVESVVGKGSTFTVRLPVQTLS
jgi:GAF domain-containing protein/CheY-like chemotaxis protein